MTNAASGSLIQRLLERLRRWLAGPLGHFFDNPRLLVKYISAGGLAATIELTLFSLLHQHFAWPLLIANSSALVVAVIASFMLQKHWTFGAQGGARRQFRLYVLMQGISALLNTALIYLFVARWDWPPPLAKLVQIGLVFIWNFSFCKIVIFAERGEDSVRRP